MSTAPETSSFVQFHYNIGGFRVSLDSFPFHESEYLAAFREECRQAPELYLKIRAVPELPFPNGVVLNPVGETLCLDAEDRPVRYCLTEKKDAVLYRVTALSTGRLFAEMRAVEAANLGSYLVLRWLDLPGFCLAGHAVFLHASLIRYQGKAILFLGQKQIGKSTQAELWRKYRGAEVLNGDRALLRQRQGRWYAWGSPFCGTSGICVNAQAPLGAIVLLAQDTENRVRAASPREVLKAFLSGCSYDPSDRIATERVLDLAEEIGQTCPVLRLCCRPDEGAVDCLDIALRKEAVYVG